jgi:hypothetical protein
MLTQTYLGFKEEGACIKPWNHIGSIFLLYNGVWGVKFMEIVSVISEDSKTFTKIEMPEVGEGDGDDANFIIVQRS